MQPPPRARSLCLPSKDQKSSDKIADLPLGHVTMDGSRSENQACGVRLSDFPGTAGSFSGGVSWQTIGSSVDLSRALIDRPARQGRGEAGD